MATWTVPPTFTSTTLTAAQLNQLIGANGNLDWLKGALSAIGVTADSGGQTVDSAISGARVYNNANISIGGGAWTALTFNSEYWDTHDNAASTFHNTGANTDRLTIPAGRGGYYLVGASVEFAANATGKRGIRLVHSVGATVFATSLEDATPTGVHALTITSLWSLAAAEYVTCEAFQDSGGALNANRSADYSPEFWIAFVGV